MLDDCHILVVEDEFFLAQEMKQDLKDAGAVVLGPEPSVDRALARISKEPRIDVAVLDVNLGGEKVFPVADELAARNVPFLFVTGYENMVIHSRYPHVLKFNKPTDIQHLITALKRLLA
ncbi:response regulator [Paracoccus sp. PAMC 22219]|uniref:response regulator n=1 Tax=Paracoccus sp. PAMC 22219 TaxID=1569209 RepID=UPI0005AB87DB|nr:response regulator [Paracoccus sp. PAMC 22219]